MPVSVMKFITVKTPGSEYHLLCFAFGGSEEFFKGKGFGTPNGYVAAVVLGPNSGLLMDTMFGAGMYAMERAGYFEADLTEAWEWILRHFDTIPEGYSVMIVEWNAGIQQFQVKGVEVV